MSIETLQRRFGLIGARLRASGVQRGMPHVDIRVDGRGEYFELLFPGNGPEVGIDVVDARPAERHLLLLIRDGDVKRRFLCGFDERHWFAAAIPESARGVSGVEGAKSALRPEPVREAASRLRRKERSRRRTSAFVRQGEWFFVPAPQLQVVEFQVLRDEPLTRGRGKAHRLERAYRLGGTVVYVNRQHPTGIREERYRALSEHDRRNGNWSRMVRDPELYASGSVSHPDHATVVLRGWHRVLVNTEQQAQAMRHLAFID